MSTRAKLVISCVASVACIGGLYYLFARRIPERRERAAEMPPAAAPAPRAEVPAKKEPAIAEGFTARVTVLDSETSAPISGASVSLSLHEKPALPGQSGTTDSRGIFEAKGLLDGSYTVIASAPGFVTESERTPVALAAAGDRAITVALDPGGSISGRVLDDAGKAIAGAVVRPDVSADTVDESDEKLAIVLKLKVAVDAEGRYVLDGLPARKDYVVRAAHPDFAPTSVNDVSIASREVVESLDLVLLRGGVVAGRVIDDEAKGLPAVRLWATVDPSWKERFSLPDESIGSDPRRAPDARTDADGGFRIDHLPAGSYGLYARDPGSRRLPGDVDGVVVIDGKTTQLADIVLGAGESLVGRVVDPKGRPVAGAEVSASGSASATSAEDGTFEVTGLAPGKTNVNVRRKGYDLLIEEPTAPASDLLFTLLPTGAIIGTIHAKDQDVFPEFRIDVACRTAESIEEFTATSRDPHGSFEVHGKAGVYVLTARVAGFGPSLAAGITLAAHERKEGVVIELERGGSIRGAVVARRSREPIAGADVSAARSAEQAEDRWKPVTGGGSVTTGPDGAFTLAGVLEGKVDLEARHREHPPVEMKGIDVRAGKPTEVTVEMGEGGRIRGTARRGGKPASGVQISAMQIGSDESNEALADSEGRFEVKGLEEGEYILRLMIALAGGARGSAHAEIVVVKDGETTDVDLVEPVPVKLAGRVTSGGVPIQGGRIEVGSLEGGEVAEGEIEPSGAYSLSLPGGGLYVLKIRGLGKGNGSTVVEVAVPAGVSEARKDIDLPVGETSGVIVDAASGDAVAGAQVWAVPNGVGARTRWSLYRSARSMAVSDADGRFVLSGLAPGVYSLHAHDLGHADGRVDAVRVGDERAAGDVRIALEAGTRLAARVIDPEKRPVTEAVAFLRTPAGDLAAIEPAALGDDGLVEFSAPREGPYRLIVLHRSYAPISMPANATADSSPVTVPLRYGGKLRVQVASGLGKRAEGAAVHVVGDGAGFQGEDLVPFLEEIGLPFVTQVDGYLVLPQVPPGTYRVSARKGAAASREEQVAVSEGRTSDLRLILAE